VSQIPQSDWSPVAASNTASPPNGAPEGWLPSQVNNWGREMMAAIKVWYNTANATTISTGTDTIVLTLTTAPTSYTSGMQIGFYKSASANTGACTINVNSLGAKALVKRDGSTALGAGDLVANTLYFATYDGTSFRVHDLGIG